MTPYDVCEQQCNDCLPLAIALVLSLTVGHGVRPLNFGRCNAMRNTRDVIRDYENFGACRGNPCDVQRYVSLVKCPPAPRLRVEHNVSVPRLLALARRTPLVASLMSEYPTCNVAPVDHVVAVLGTRNSYLLVQNSYGRAWRADGLAAIPVARALKCGMTHTVVYPVAR